MAASIDQEVFEELAAILEGINPFPSPNEFNFDICRGFKKDSTVRCGNRPRRAEEQKEFAGLLSELPAMAKYVDTNNLYDKMERFIALTHCTGRHLKDACEAFNKWKAHRKTAVPNPLPMTPSRSATPQADSLESPSDLSGITSPSDVPRYSKYDERSSDFYITEKIKNLKIATPPQNIQDETDERCFDEVEAQSEKLERLGVAHLPIKGIGHDSKKIYSTIQNPLGPKSMSGGIVYVLEHTEISGIFKIGYTKSSAELRLKQSGNCYHHKTKIIHETEGGRFKGARQAEKIAHAILEHRRIIFYECPICIGYHEEWFLVSRKEAFSAVKLAEQWLKMPAYEFQEGRYKLTPNGDTTFKLMFPFSIPKMRVLIDKAGKSDNDPNAISNATSATADRETGAKISSVAAKRDIPRIFVDEIHTIIPSVESILRARSPERGVGDKGVVVQLEIEEIVETRQSRSRETTPEGDFIIVKEHKTIRRRSVSITDLQHKVGALGLEDKKQGDKRTAEIW